MREEYTREKGKDLDVRLGVLSCRIEGQELVFRVLRLVRKGEDSNPSMNE